VLAVRYAIYFSPAKDHPLTEAASRWLGRNAFSGAQHDDHDAYAEMTEEPRRYGFHATLKAPFELAEKYSEAELVAAVEQFAASQSVFDIPRVVVGALGPFFALVPDRTYQPLQDFAAEIVDHFDRFRAPLSETDIALRRPQNLTESQRQNLSLWGYPHVMDDFRFHMTLTGRIDENDAPAIRDVLSARFSEFVDRPLTISGLALFIEKTRGEPFTVHRWHPLGQQPKKDATP
jgi:putative phosphonate metabolism protein